MGFLDLFRRWRLGAMPASRMESQQSAEFELQHHCNLVRMTAKPTSAAHICKVIDSRRVCRSWGCLGRAKAQHLGARTWLSISEDLSSPLSFCPVTMAMVSSLQCALIHLVICCSTWLRAKGQRWLSSTWRTARRFQLQDLQHRPKPWRSRKQNSISCPCLIATETPCMTCW